jgi:hypothetical protein
MQFDAQESDELSFGSGDLIELIAQVALVVALLLDGVFFILCYVFIPTEMVRLATLVTYRWMKSGFEARLEAKPGYFLAHLLRFLCLFPLHHLP